ncbi:MAG: hypothetical protein KatS3mg108_0443 [Isosphaeraceae bacterium]|jgi:radical SAM-linked protein|nr:MAG: hypothetical protein KatS3mg108_0443 [Isosphaeraceae bacterium]
MPPTRIRLRFAKHGDLRLISHHDLLRCLERAVRRAGLPVAMTQGFTPRPKLNFAQALALGIEGRREVLELELDAPIEPAEVRDRLAATLPAGFAVLEARQVPPGRPAQAVAADYCLEVPEPLRPAVRRALEAFLAAPCWPSVRVRGDRRTELDIRPLVLGARLDHDGRLCVRLALDPMAGSIRPAEWLEALGLDELAAIGTPWIREDLILADEMPGALAPALPSGAGVSVVDAPNPNPNSAMLLPNEAESAGPPS